MSEAPVQKTLEFGDNALIALLYGEHNTHLSHIESKLKVDISDRGNTLTISGSAKNCNLAEKLINKLWQNLENKQEIGIQEIDAALRFLKPASKNKNKATANKTNKGAKAMSDSDIAIKTKKKTIAPRSPNQAGYIRSIVDNEMVFGLGPAGTGKTYLAVAVGVSMFLEGKVERLIFTRPAIEAGENLGFLPGDLKEKVDPYLRPIYDALQDMIPLDIMQKKIEAGEIEIAPLAFMRGRTLSNAFVILDEAQNTTCTQMKMFLTRMGEASRMVITGDITQTDLPVGVKSGLRDATEILDGVDGINFTRFTQKDVTRHKLVGRIIKAYDQKSRDK